MTERTDRDAHLHLVERAATRSPRPGTNRHVGSANAMRTVLIVVIGFSLVLVMVVALVAFAWKAVTR